MAAKAEIKYGFYRCNPKDEGTPMYRWLITYPDVETAGVSPGEPPVVDSASVDPATTYSTPQDAQAAAERYAKARAAVNRKAAAEAAKAAESAAEKADPPAN